MCQSVCVSLHLFKINLKFLKDHNYWLAQFLHISLVSVCVSMDLFRFNVKFLKTHNYWLGQLFHMSLVSGLELKTCRMHIKILRNSSKKKWWGRHYCQLLGQNSLVTNLNSYLVLAGNNESFSVTPSTSNMYNTYTQYIGDQHWQQCWFFRFFSILCPSFWLSVCVCTSVYNLKFLKTHNYWLARLYMWALFQG